MIIYEQICGIVEKSRFKRLHYTKLISVVRAQSVEQESHWWTSSKFLNLLLPLFSSGRIIVYNK
jgi:hypothetical protein